MTDRDALTRAVCAHPDEDTPRLALADDLDEHGDDGDRVRARFIRVQCELTTLEEQAPRWRKLYAEERKLLGDLNRRNLLWPARLKGRTFGSSGYERGFLAQITVFAKRFLAEAGRFFADDPIQTVRFAKLTGKSNTVPIPTLFASPHLAPLRTLDLSGSGLRAPDLVRLAAAPHLGGLKTLVLRENQLSPIALDRIIGSGSLASLAHLDLTKNPAVGDDEAAAMVSQPSFRRVRSLDMLGSAITVRGVRAIAASPHAAGLEKLRVGAWDFTRVPSDRPLGTVPDHTAMAEAVAGSPHLAGLKELDLSWRQMGLAGLEALANSPHLTNLRRLRLAKCNFPAGAARVVAAAKNFAGLYALELGVTVPGTPGTVPPEDEARVRAALPDAAVRFQ